MSAFRVYFFDLDTRKEITDHSANGKTWLGTSANVFVDGQFVPDTCTHVMVANYADLSRVSGERKVTAADFPGRRVAVKVWYAPGNVEWRKLLA